MEEHEIKELTETTYGLMVVLKDTIWKFEGIGKDNQRKFSVILALVDTLEQNIYNIKISLECM